MQIYIHITCSFPFQWCVTFIKYIILDKLTAADITGIAAVLKRTILLTFILVKCKKIFQSTLPSLLPFSLNLLSMDDICV